MNRVTGTTISPDEQARIQRERNKDTLKIRQISNGFLVTEVGSGNDFTYPDIQGVIQKLKQFYGSK